MAEAKGPLEIELTIRYGVDKQGRVTLDWEASATVPKGMTPPRVDQYMAKQIMEAAAGAMEVKQSLNWEVREIATPLEEPKTDSDPDRLP